MNWQAFTKGWNNALCEVYAPATIRPSAKELAEQSQDKLKEVSQIIKDMGVNYYD